MSRSKYDGYAKYSTYNNNSSNVNVNVDTTSRFANAPPPPMAIETFEPKQSSPLPPPPQQPQPDEPSRVNYVDPNKLYDLLMNPQYHYVQNQQPLKIFIKVFTDWCKPCKLVASDIKKLSLDPQYSNILFVEIDGDKLTQHEKLASVLRVSSVPSFFTFMGGKQVGFMTGIKLDEIVTMCNGLLQ